MCALVSRRVRGAPLFAPAIAGDTCANQPPALHLSTCGGHSRRGQLPCNTSRHPSRGVSKPAKFGLSPPAPSEPALRRGTVQPGRRSKPPETRTARAPAARMGGGRRPGAGVVRHGHRSQRGCAEAARSPPDGGRRVGERDSAGGTWVEGSPLVPVPWRLPAKVGVPANRNHGLPPCNLQPHSHSAVPVSAACKEPKSSAAQQRLFVPLPFAVGIIDHLGVAREASVWQAARNLREESVVGKFGVRLQLLRAVTRPVGCVDVPCSDGSERKLLRGAWAHWGRLGWLGRARILEEAAAGAAASLRARRPLFCGSAGQLDLRCTNVVRYLSYQLRWVSRPKLTQRTSL